MARVACRCWAPYVPVPRAKPLAEAAVFGYYRARIGEKAMLEPILTVMTFAAIGASVSQLSGLRVVKKVREELGASMRRASLDYRGEERGYRHGDERVGQVREPVLRRD